MSYALGYQNKSDATKKAKQYAKSQDRDTVILSTWNYELHRTEYAWHYLSDWYCECRSPQWLGWYQLECYSTDGKLFIED